MTIRKCWQSRPPLDRRFTTLELLRAEQRIVEHAEHGRGQGAGVLSDEHAAVVLANLPRPLSDEQQRVVRAITAAGHRIDTVEALAATGKTTSAGRCGSCTSRPGTG